MPLSTFAGCLQILSRLPVLYVLHLSPLEGPILPNSVLVSSFTYLLQFPYEKPTAMKGPWQLRFCPRFVKVRCGPVAASWISQHRQIRRPPYVRSYLEAWEPQFQEKTLWERKGHSRSSGRVPGYSRSSSPSSKNNSRNERSHSRNGVSRLEQCENHDSRSNSRSDSRKWWEPD